MEPHGENISTDALPVTPRPSIGTEDTAQNTSPVQAEATNRQHIETVNTSTSTDPTDDDFGALPDPPPDWKFNNFLDDIADGITDKELKKLKHLFRGEGGIGKAALEQIQTPLDLFDILRTRRYLHRDNMIYLQAMLRRIGRMDLIRRAVKYANTIGNVIHLYPASDQPENGFRYVKFHVVGRNYQNSSRSDIQQFRDKIAAILFVPAEFIIIAGVEPTCSLLITLMIPELYATILTEILKGGHYQVELKNLSIDIVEVDSYAYNITDIKVGETEQQVKLTNVYQQLEQISKHLEDSEIERLRLTKELDQGILTISELEKEKLEYMYDSNWGMLQAPDKRLYSVLYELQRALDKLKNILHEYRSFESRHVYRLIPHVERLISVIQTDELPEIVDYEVDISNAIILGRLHTLAQALQVPVKVQLTEKELQNLKMISLQLPFWDKMKLASKYTWETDENRDLPRVINDQRFFLALILYKEMQKVKQYVDIVEFISKCLNDIGSGHLDRMFRRLVRDTEKKPNVQKTYYIPDDEILSPQKIDKQILSPKKIDKQILSPQKIDKQILSPQKIDKEILSPKKIDKEILSSQKMEFTCDKEIP